MTVKRAEFGLERVLFKKYLQNKFKKDSYVVVQSEDYNIQNLETLKYAGFGNSLDFASILKPLKTKRGVLDLDRSNALKEIRSLPDVSLFDDKDEIYRIEGVERVDSSFKHTDRYAVSSDVVKKCVYILNISKYKCSETKKGKSWKKSQTDFSEEISMVVCPPGTFTMGLKSFPEDLKSEKSDTLFDLSIRPADKRDKENPEHDVTLTKPFELGAYEVSSRLFKFITEGKYDPKGYDQASVTVSWFDCLNFCNILSDLCGLERAYEIKRISRYFYEDIITYGLKENTNGFRLPTEAEWEYAAKAGFGNRSLFAGVVDLKNASQVDGVAWTDRNIKRNVYKYEINGPYESGKKKPNAWGLYDMSGNVMEWCQDSGFTGWRNYPGDRYKSFLNELKKRVDPLIHYGDYEVDFLNDSLCSTSIFFCITPMVLRAKKSKDPESNTDLHLEKTKEEDMLDAYRPLNEGVFIPKKRVYSFVLFDALTILIGNRDPKKLNFDRIVRGGSWNQEPSLSRITNACSYNIRDKKAYEDNYIGFRIARTVKD